MLISLISVRFVVFSAKISKYIYDAVTKVSFFSFFGFLPPYICIKTQRSPLANAGGLLGFNKKAPGFLRGQQPLPAYAIIKRTLWLSILL